MKQLLTFFISLFILTSCATPQVSNLESTLVVTPTLPQPSATFTFIVLSPTPTSTVTPQVCDSTVSDFCIVSGNFFLQSPLNASLLDSLSRSYGYGSTDGGKRDPHHGVDFNAANGAPVLAAADGTIVFAGFEKEATHSPWQNFYGNFVVIRHANDVYTLYAHLSQILVETGQEVRVGEVIGEVGDTGVAIGPHLHLEVRRGGNGEDYFSTENPELWLIPYEGMGTLSITLKMGIEKNTAIPIVVSHYVDGSTDPVFIYYISSYARDFEFNAEDAVLGSLPPGRYRITFNDASVLRERFVTVEAGKLTEVVFDIR